MTTAGVYITVDHIPDRDGDYRWRVIVNGVVVRASYNPSRVEAIEEARQYVLANNITARVDDHSSVGVEVIIP